VAGLRGSGDATAGALTASGAPKKDLAGKTRLAADWALEPAASGAERGSERRARERDIAMASLAQWLLPLGLPGIRIGCGWNDNERARPGQA
jgi:hypothetical protein